MIWSALLIVPAYAAMTGLYYVSYRLWELLGRRAWLGILEHGQRRLSRSSSSQTTNIDPLSAGGQGDET